MLSTDQYLEPRELGLVSEHELLCLQNCSRGVRLSKAFERYKVRIVNM